MGDSIDRESRLAEVCFNSRVAGLQSGKMELGQIEAGPGTPSQTKPQRIIEEPPIQAGIYCHRLGSAAFSPARCGRSMHHSDQEHMPDPTSKPKVLVADDERVIADTLAMILNQSGFQARAVYSGEKALELAPTFQPDMLISDVIMADLNGIDAAIRIRALLPSIKILLFSGQAATADLLEKARAKGYEFEILAKPVHPQDLLNKLRS